MILSMPPTMHTQNKKREFPPPQISWENILTSLEDGVIVIDPLGNVSFYNPAAEMLTDLSASQALHKPYSRLFKKNPWLIQMVKKSQPPHQRSTRGEEIWLTPLGRQFPLSLTVSSLQDPHGRSLGSILLLRDLSRRKELEEDLKRSDRLATLATLAAGLAHEIKNPLGGIRGSAQLLQRSLGKDPSVVEYTDIIIREVDRVNLLIEQLLDLSRPAKLNLTSVNIHEILDEVLLLEREDVQQGKILIKKQFDPSLPHIRGDRDQLIQVFLNLVKNALQAIDGEGQLTITTRIETDFHIIEHGRKQGKFIRVEIEDNGGGIKDENLAHIFSPYFTTRINGTGLGLAISDRIIQEHGGLIRVESREGNGTIFKVLLLVVDATNS